MAHKKSNSLGRGLDALLAGARNASVESKERVTEKEFNFPSVDEKNYNSTVIPTSTSISEKNSNLLELPLKKLIPGKYQPRSSMDSDELQALSDSIRVSGILQPIVVRPLSQGQFEIIAGERRFQASKLAGLETIPVIIKDVQDKEALSLALIENIQRENLNPLEEALALERLTKEFGLTHIQIAESLGKSRTTVTNLLRILTLTDEVKAFLEKGMIDLGHAKVLLGLKGSLQIQIATEIVEKKLSVREAEKLIAKATNPKENTALSASRPPMDPDIRKLQEKISEKLSAPVQLAYGNDGKGKIIIQFDNLDVLDGILAHLKLDERE